MVRALAYAGAFALTLVLSSPAAADSIEITSGSATLYRDGSLGGVTIASGDSHFASEHHVAALSAFAAGATVDLSTTIPFVNDGHHPLAVTYRGQQFPEAWLSGSMTIVAKTFVAPRLNGGGSTSREFTTTFTMTGTVTGWSTPARTGTPLFSTRVSGGGTISAGPYRIVGDRYVLAEGGEALSFRADVGSAAPRGVARAVDASGSADAALHASPTTASDTTSPVGVTLVTSATGLSSDAPAGATHTPAPGAASGGTTTVAK
jgi:hypothetical protein